MDLRAITEAIRERLDLRVIIDDVRKQGSAYMRLCPFHPDGDPSLQINKEYYYCHGCQARGDIFDWYQYNYKVNFMAALGMAAAEASIPIEDGIHEQLEKSQRIRKEREQQQEVYTNVLKNYDDGLNYLLSRGLTKETIEYFGLGYDGETDRISIPIYDKAGRIQTYAYRAASNNVDPDKRYRIYNTSEWKKDQNFYNPGAIEWGTGPIVITEGFFDCMTVWQAGHKRVVAMMGASLNDAKVNLLGDNPLIFMPDAKKPDDFELFRKSVFRLRASKPDLIIKVALLEAGDANSAGCDAVIEAINNAESAEFAILKHDLNNAISKEDEYKLARKVVNDVRDILVRDDIINYLCKRWEKPKDVVLQAMSRSEGPPVTIITMTEALLLVEERERAISLEGLHMGWSSLSRLIKTPNTGQLLFFAGRAGVGKTMWALNYLYQTYSSEIPTLFLSFEQPITEIVKRLAVMVSNQIEPTDSYKLHRHIVDNDNQWIVNKSMMEMMFPHLRMSDKRLDAKGVIDAIVDASYSMGRGIKVIIIDYFGLMKGGRGDSYERTSYLAREIQEVTKEAGVFAINLTQLSRAGGDGTVAPTMDMMRDSGVVEEVADYIIGAWKDKTDEAASDGNLMRMHTRILKNRHGETGDGFLWFDKRSLRMTEPDYTHSDWGTQ